MLTASLGAEWDRSKMRYPGLVTKLHPVLELSSISQIDPYKNNSYKTEILDTIYQCSNYFYQEYLLEVIIAYLGLLLLVTWNHIIACKL